MKTAWTLLGWGLTLVATAQVTLPPLQANLQLELGWSSWGLSGNVSKFRQYATPPRGFFLRTLRYELPATQLLWQGGGDQDTYGDAFTHLQAGRLTLQARHARTRFTDPGTTLSSERRSEETTLRYLLTPDFALTARLRQERTHRLFATPHVPYNQTTHAYDLIAEGLVGQGRLSLQYTRGRYHDRTDTRPNTTFQRLQAGYLWEPNPILGLEATWSEIRLMQPQRPNSGVQNLALMTDWMLTSSTALSLMWTREQLNLPVVRNAWTRERRTGALHLNQQLGSWRLQIGLRRQAIDRWNASQNLLEPLQRESLEARLSGRLDRQTRLTLYGIRQRWSREASSPIATSLFWSQRETIRLNLERNLTHGALYLSITRQRWLNDARNTRLHSDQLLAGGAYQIRTRMTLLAEHRLERFSASGDTVGLLRLTAFLPETRSSTFGLQWTSEARLSAGLHFTHFVSSTNNPLLLPDGNTEARLLTISVQYQLSNGSTWSLTFAPWHYRDRVDPRLDYRLSLLSLSWSYHF
jgi:hypothetical protein